MNRQLKWFLVNGLFGALAWFGMVEEVNGAKNIILFVIWSMLVTIIFVSGMKEKPEKLQKQLSLGHSVPRCIDVPYDIFILGILIWTGWIITAIAYLIHSCLQNSLIDEYTAKSGVNNG